MYNTASPTKKKNPLSSIDIICRSVKLDTKTGRVKRDTNKATNKVFAYSCTSMHLWKSISQSFSFLHRVAPVTTCNVAFQSFIIPDRKIWGEIIHRQASVRAILPLLERDFFFLEESNRTPVVDLYVCICPNPLLIFWKISHSCHFCN